MAKTIEELIVELRADVHGYHTALQNSAKQTASWSDDVKRRVGSVGKAFAGLSLAAVAAGLGAITREALRGAEESQRMAQSLGANVEAVQELQFAFREFGSDSNDVADALNTLADRAEDAKEGTKSFIDDFKLLGVSVDDLRGKRPEQLFELMAERVSEIEDPTKRAAGVVRIFGDDLGRRLLPLLIEGADGLARFRQEARDVGAVLDEDTIQSMVDANREFRQMRNILDASMAKSVADNAESLKTLAGALGTIAAISARAVGGATGFVESITKDLLALFGTIELTDVERIGEALTDTERRIQSLKLSLESQRVPGRRTIIEAQIEEAQREADNLRGFLRLSKELRADQEEALAARRVGPDTGAAPTGAGDGGQELSDTEAKLRRAAALHTQSLIDEEQRELDQNQKLIDLQEERFRRIRELALESQERHREAEQLRFENEQAELQAELERLRERNLLTSDLEEQFRRAREDQEAIHQARLAEIEEAGEQERLEKARELTEARVLVATSLLDVVAAAAVEGSKLQRAAAATSKAFALVEATVNLGRALSEANTIPFPGNLIAYAKALQIGTQAIGLIKGANVQGVAHAGLTDVEREGTYLLNRGERVVAPAQNEDLTRFLQGGGRPLQVIIQEAPGGNVENRPRVEADGRLVIEQVVRRTMEKDLASGRGLSTTLQRTFGLTRKGQI